MGYHWTQQLDLEAKQAARSVNRGLGAARQSAEFDIMSVAAAWKQSASHIDGVPVYPEPTIVLGSLWILREIEVAWAAVGDVAIDFTTQIVEWILPVSKTDTRAKACSRSWGCLCVALPSRSAVSIL